MKRFIRWLRNVFFKYKWYKDGILLTKEQEKKWGL